MLVLSLASLYAAATGCHDRSSVTPTESALVVPNSTAVQQLSTSGAEVSPSDWRDEHAWDPTRLASAHAAPQPIVLFDSYHAHNFLDRGLIPGETTYHRFTGLRRAANLLTQRGVEVRELIVGPLTPRRLEGVRLIVVNLPSMDRPPWLVPEIETVEKFVRGGGGILFITDHSNCYYHQYHLLPLWDRLGLVPTFETVCERRADCLLSQGGPGWFVVRKFDEHPVTRHVNYLAVQTGGRVEGEGIVARTSEEAWADTGAVPLYGEGNLGLFGDMRYSESEQQGAQGMVLARSLDRGRMVVISDQNALGDACISYADNWRLWLAACDWAGDLDIELQPVSTVPDQPSPPPDAQRARPVFDSLVGEEPDRNAPLTLPPDAWHIECWEPLPSGPFHWGGPDPEQLYSFWCWMNRWAWASAHVIPSNPAPQGRTMLIAVESDLQDLKLRARAQEVFKRDGKVIVLGCTSSSPGPPNAPQARRAAERPAGLPAIFESLGLQSRLSSVSDDNWHDEPLVHCQIRLNPGTLVVVPDASGLRNAQFPPLDAQPSAAASQWLSRFHRWLFERP